MPGEKYDLPGVFASVLVCAVILAGLILGAVWIGWSVRDSVRNDRSASVTEPEILVSPDR